MLASYYVFMDFGINIFEICLIVYFLKEFNKFRINNSLFVVSTVLLQSVLVTIIHYTLEKSSFSAVIAMILVLSIINYGTFTEKLIRIVPLVLIWMVVLGVVEVLALYGLSLSLGIPVEEFLIDPLYKILLALTSRCVLLLLIGKTYKILIVSRELKKIYLLELIAILVINIAIIVVFPHTLLMKTSTKISFALVLFMVIAASVSIIKLFNGIMKFASREAEYELQLQYISNMHEFIHKLRAQRHDFNHHLGCIYGLLEDDQYKEAKGYTEQLINKTDELNNLLKTNNPYVTAILNHKLSIAKQKEINLDVDVDIPSKLIIEPADLSIIIGNVLDNAIEACEKVEGYKYIKISIYEKLSYLVIFIKNSAPIIEVGSSSGFLKTSKEDNENHGFGIKNIKYVVDKNSGKIEMSQNEGEFTVNILLNNLK